jgi:hypothetical protein
VVASGSPEPGASGGVTRREFEMVMRRAAELAAADVDSQDRLSEDELIRIGGEVGLPAHYVRQALYDVQEGVPAEGLVGRSIGPGRVVAVRSVRGSAPNLVGVLERYLTMDEYLRVVRRRDDQATFAPSSDLVSKIARAFRGVGGKYALAQVRTLTVTARPLDQQHAHLRLDLDLADRRRNALVAGTLTGGGVGAVVGFGAGVVASIIVGGSAPDANLSLYMGIGGAAVGLGGGLSLGIAAARAWFRRLSAGFRTEAEGLLDRVERGDELDAGTAPWRRRMDRIIGRWTSGAH